MDNYDEYLLDECKLFFYLLWSWVLYYEQIGVEDMNGDISVMSQSWFMDLSLRLAKEVAQRNQLFNMGDAFRCLLIARG